jgi:hypothetical protein
MRAVTSLDPNAVSNGASLKHAPTADLPASDTSRRVGAGCHRHSETRSEATRVRPCHAEAGRSGCGRTEGVASAYRCAND